uniref:Uncharacterized protein n=1 Tax=Panagrolaimus sp. ES5 TaxID=591445 RepID=A0AC34GL81_9BILA
MPHYVPLQRNHLSWSPDIKLLLKELIRTRCEPYTVAVLKHKDETLEPEILVADGANKP